MIHNDKGMMSISGLIVLCVMSILIYYLHDLYLKEERTVEVLQTSSAARNFTLSEASKLIALYADDRTVWEKACSQANNRYDLSEGVLVDAVQKQDERFGTVSINAYLAHYQGSTYTLIIESTVSDITNQICIYLTEKDDELIVERWER